MSFTTLLAILCIHSFVYSHKTFDGKNECIKHCENGDSYATRYCGNLCSSTVGAQTFYCYLGCAHNATTSEKFTDCIGKCKGNSYLSETSCNYDCQSVSSHPEVCSLVCGENDGGIFSICLYNCDHENSNRNQNDFDKCKEKCYKMESQRSTK
uniref:Hypotheticial protein n=1 Tax=Schistosoma japonicum TaxID=6182 RepID=C7TZ30_SCHJA|nr:hypotheticial protein [Schistosoma japonicum]CAX82873.1 hypotheticial protein [Schistosoma japonicum]